VTPIGQQNPTRTPKTVRFARKKQAKIPIFNLLRKTEFLDTHFVTSASWTSTARVVNLVHAAVAAALLRHFSGGGAGILGRDAAMLATLVGTHILV
jgi:hypothetical protein